MGNLDSVDGNINALTSLFRDFFQDTTITLFDIAIKYFWLEKQLVFDGKRRVRRFRNGHVPDSTFGRYMKQVVGHDHSLITRARWCTVVTLYLKDMFPEFLDHDPFKEPEYYKYPFKHVTLEFLMYVFQVHNRLELLDYAEQKQMSYHDFRNWANNHVLSYNDEQNFDVYAIAPSRDGALYIKRHDWDAYENEHAF